MTNTDFAFLAGTWISRQRRRTKVLAGCDEWYEFDATLNAQILLDGNATFDVLKAPERNIEGLTLRLYDPDEKAWRIWWASEKSRGKLDEPVVTYFPWRRNGWNGRQLGSRSVRAPEVTWCRSLPLGRTV
jgi:hypothetical protein